MLRYENKGHVIDVALPTEKFKGFSIECHYLFDKEIGKYMVSMWLKNRNLNSRYKIDGQEIDTQPLSGTPETIRQNLCNVIEYALNTGFFDMYLERYKKLVACTYEEGEPDRNPADNEKSELKTA